MEQKAGQHQKYSHVISGQSRVLLIYSHSDVSITFVSPVENILTARNFSYDKLGFIKVSDNHFKTPIEDIYLGRFELENIDPILYELISRMIQPNAVDRITIEGVLKHPTFWEKDKILRFLSETSDRLEREETDSEILNSIEQFKEEVGGEDWKLRLAERKFQL